jgi:Lrp/AsnC family transcriptional regulator, leucine-responsive regulatory protein
LSEDTNRVRPRLSPPSRLDDRDRTLLGLLAEDTTRSYADLGKLLNLSAPAVHERVKRLRQDGVIKANVAVLDGAKLGRPLLTFVHVDTTSWAVTRQLLALKELPEVEEIHTVTGESAMLLKVRTRDTQALEDLLERIHSIEGFKGTRSYIALSTYLERGPSPIVAE